MKVNSRGITTIVVLALSLSACCSKDDDTSGGGPTVPWTPHTSSIFTTPTPPPPPAQPTYTVPDDRCKGYFDVPLVVTTDTAAELQYLDKVDACTTKVGTETYLKNNSDAVWVLRNTGPVGGTVTPRGDTLTRSSFRSIFAAGQTFLVPGGVVTVNLPPKSVAWDLNLPLTVSWVGHGVVANEIKSFSQQALIGALKRTNRYSPALIQCTLAATKYAETVDGLADKQLSTVLMEGLGVGIAGSKCHEETLKVSVPERTTKVPIAMSEDLARASKVTTFLEGIDSYLDFAKKGSQYFKLAIRFIPRIP